jgi:exosortase D (VPLPA-CTERM-specific)
MAISMQESVGTPRGAQSVSLSGAVVVTLLLLSGGIYFHEGIDALLTAWRLPEYSHGPLIPLLSGFLFLRDFKSTPVRVGPVEDRWPGVLVVFAAIILGGVGKIARIDDIVAYAMIGFIAGLMLTTLGWRRGIRCWPAIVHLAFMLPLPATLYWKVSTTLQFISSELGVWFIRAAGVPVFLDGNIIDLGIYKLHVAEACSGLRYLYPILSFSYIFAALYRGPIWHKAVLLISAAPITVFMNSVRIGIIGVIVDNFGLEHVEGITHLLEGWVIFIASVLILFAMARVMLALQRSSMSLSEALDLDFAGIRPQLERIALVRPSAALITALVLTAGATATWTASPDRTLPAFDRLPLALFPDRLDDWRRVDTQTLDARIERALGADDYLSTTYRNLQDGTTADLFIAWYKDQTKGGIHSPEVCLPGSGWEMAEIGEINIAASEGASHPVNRAIIQKGEQRLLVYYWFEQFGGRTASDYVAKASLLRDGVLHGRTDGAIVRVITPLLPGQPERRADARLREVVDSVKASLPRFVPTLETARR